MKFGEVSSEIPTPGYRNYVLGIFAMVYALNFIDRQIISVLALDLKRDLSLTDADLGFLYGTAFGVFYALFGIPMGRLADSWNRIRLTTIGLALWSAMTLLSGFARNGLQLTAARIGVGIGEATASPCAYSILSDYFPRERRATALATYSAGMYVGAGLSLFIGAEVLKRWGAAFPNGWNGIVGWQAAFFIVGVPGLLLALVVASIKEPIRGLSDGVTSPQEPQPFRGFINELVTMLPPFSLYGAARRGMPALLINLLGAAIIGSLAWLLVAVTGDELQWIAVALGCYAVFSWVSAVRERDYPAFSLIWKSPAFLLLTIGNGLTSFVNYAVAFWSLPYAESVLGADKSVAALIIGGSGAAGGFLGLMVGGRLADRLKLNNPAGRVTVIIASSTLPFIPLTLSFTTDSTLIFYAMHLPMVFLSSLGLGAAGATTQDLVLPRMRGLATATFFLGLTMIGLALGPYSVGRISALTGSLSTGILSLLVVVPFSTAMLFLLYRKLPNAEASVVERARAAGENI